MDTASHPNKILVIEDERALRKALWTKLTHQGFTIVEAPNGAIGLEMATTMHPDIILLDIIMPHMDGITMLRKLREDPWGKTVPVIILTNLSDGQDAPSLKADYLIKTDWTLEDVTQKIMKALNISDS